MAEEEEEEEISEEVWADKLKLENMIFTAYVAIKIGLVHIHVSFLGIKLSSKGIKKKVKLMIEIKVNHLNPLIML